ncbi:hypothetical protein [Sphingomonas sp. PB4P5]|uniref:hypothetical protein n=1 Tax=Parasphingomonas puruogangriensis TaxID=3096155 RepID=UPI002FC8C051
MHISYDDITKRIAEPPNWWLEGVPRYRSFRPDDLDVYAQEVVLMEVECQMCFRKFNIGQYSPNAWHPGQHLPLHGDPPSHSSDAEESCGGESMGFTELRIFEFWRRARYDPAAEPPVESHWVRDHNREIAYKEDTASK